MADKAHILVIDDEDLVRDSIRETLVRAGYRATCAANGADGLKMLAAESIDIVITDILMPEKEGVETIIEIKKSRPGTPIIAISGGGRCKNLDPLKIANRIGADRTLPKPLNSRDLLSMVQEVTAEISRKQPTKET